MISKLKEHPEYPFSEENLEGTVHDVERFRSDPPLSALEKGEVLEFVRLTRQYAFLERLIQGEILFDLPVHLDLGSVTVESLAAQERELLGLTAVPGGELLDALDERGIKTFRRSRGPESPEMVTGGFFYAGEFGPGASRERADEGRGGLRRRACLRAPRDGHQSVREPLLQVAAHGSREHIAVAGGRSGGSLRARVCSSPSRSSAHSRRTWRGKRRGMRGKR